MSIFKRILGAVILLIGINILGWVAYNFLVQMQPESEGRNPLPAFIFSAGAIYVGSRWLFGKPKTDPKRELTKL